MLECTRFQGKQWTINIPQEIGPNYYYFGLHLLDDPNGTRVHSLELEYRQNTERINTEILREWVSGRGKKPVTWETLTEVLHDIELGALASEIEEVKSRLTTSTILWTLIIALIWYTAVSYNFEEKFLTFHTMYRMQIKALLYVQHIFK